MNCKALSLKEIVSEIIDYRGKTPKKLGADWSDTGYRALSAKNIKTGEIVQEDTIRFVDDDLYHKWMKQEVDRGTILITSEAPFGQVLYWNSDEKIVLSQRIFGLKIKSEFDSKYIYYYMTSSNYQYELSGRATGSTVTGLRQPELLKTTIRCPDIYQQKKISKILSNIDAKIECNNRTNDNLLEISKTIFSNDFSDKIRGGKEIGDYLVPKRGKALLSKDAIKGDIPVIAGGLEPATFHNLANTKAPVITISASGANAGFVNLWQREVWSSDSSFIDATITENPFFWYVMLVVRQDEIYKAQTGSAQAHIYPKHIAEMSIGDIKQSEISTYEKKVASIFEQIEQNKTENRRLTKLRDTLLPELLNGRIDISNIDV